jgi:hypothetical protein
MRRIIIILLVATAALTASAAFARAGETSYADAVGDSGTAPDLTNVTVLDTNGFLVFKIDGALVPSSSFELFIDADRNRTTGDDGDELWISVFQEGDGKNYWDAERWNGSKWEDVTFDVTSRTFPGRVEIGFSATQAGLTGPFDFVVTSVKMVADAVESVDRAPDSIAPWTYTLAAPAAAGTTTVARAVLGKLTLSPAKPVSGKPVTLRVSVRNATTGQPMVATAPACTLTVKGRTVTGRATATAGLVTCRLVVPKGTAGALGRASITAGSGASAVTRSYSFRIL